MGYSLNQRGISVGVVRDPHNRARKLSKGTPLSHKAVLRVSSWLMRDGVNVGKLLTGMSEREIFDMLGGLGSFVFVFVL